MNKRLLLIEDDNLVANMLATMLAKSGFVCDHAEDENQALIMFRNARIKGDRYDLLVVDLVLGENNCAGVKVTQQIKIEQPDIVAILCSGFSSSPVVLNYQEYGFDFCLKKPFSWDRLKGILAEQFHTDSPVY